MTKRTGGWSQSSWQTYTKAPESQLQQHVATMAVKVAFHIGKTASWLCPSETQGSMLGGENLTFPGSAMIISTLSYGYCSPMPGSTRRESCRLMCFTYHGNSFTGSVRLSCSRRTAVNLVKMETLISEFQNGTGWMRSSITPSLTLHTTKIAGPPSQPLHSDCNHSEVMIHTSPVCGARGVVGI